MSVLCNDTATTQISTYCPTLSLHGALAFPLAPSFVLWAADCLRRSYQGGVQRWADIEKVLGLHLSQGDWRDLADQGFRAWGVEPLITAHGNQRLSNLARQGGFPNRKSTRMKSSH